VLVAPPDFVAMAAVMVGAAVSILATLALV
jgi:hypothetical protein